MAAFRTAYLCFLKLTLVARRLSPLVLSIVTVS